MASVLQLSQEVPLFSVEWAKDHGVRIGVILALAVVVSWIASIVVRRMRRRMEEGRGSSRATDLQRAATLASIIGYTVRVVIWTIAVLMVLSEIGLNLAPLLTGAGIAGVALGFGAQSLVRDFLAGFFILLEDQFGVTDNVDLSVPGGAVRGQVENLTLRKTEIRGDDGTLYIVPNGNLQVVSNLSRGEGAVSVAVKVSGEQAEEAKRALEQMLRDLSDEDQQALGLSPGSTTRVVESRVPGDGVLIRVGAQTAPYRRAEAERELGARIQDRLAGFGAELVASSDAR